MVESLTTLIRRSLKRIATDQGDLMVLVRVAKIT